MKTLTKTSIDEMKRELFGEDKVPSYIAASHGAGSTASLGELIHRSSGGW